MALALSVSFRAASDLRGFLAQAQHGAALLPLAQLPAGVAQYSPVELQLAVEGQRCSLTGSVLQTMEGVGLVVQLDDTAAAEDLAARAPVAPSPEPPHVAVIADDAETDPPSNERSSARATPPGMGPLSWPIERLQAEFASLTMAEKVRVAKYGKRPARMLVLRQQDKTLHNFVLSNNGVTAEEVAALAGMASADHGMLRRIATSPEWLRHTAIVRNLVCNPKMTLPEVVKLLKHLPLEEARRLSKTGRVRAAVKREIIRRIDRG